MSPLVVGFHLPNRSNFVLYPEGTGVFGPQSLRTDSVRSAQGASADVEYSHSLPESEELGRQRAEWGEWC